MVDIENYEELPGGDELYTDLDQFNDMQRPVINQSLESPESTPITNAAPAPPPPPSVIAPALPDRNKLTSNFTPSPSAYVKTTAPPVIPNKFSPSYGVPSIASPKGPEDTRVLQAYQKLIQAKKAKVSKVNSAIIWAKRPDLSGEQLEYLTLAGLGPNIPFTPPCILVKMLPGTEACSGNYMRLFVPPLAQGQNIPTKTNVSLIQTPSTVPITQVQPPIRSLQEIPSSFSTAPDGEEFYDDALNVTTSQQEPPAVPRKPTLPSTEQTTPPPPITTDSFDITVISDTVTNTTDVPQPSAEKLDELVTNTISNHSVTGQENASKITETAPEPEPELIAENPELLYDDVMLVTGNSNAKSSDTHSITTDTTEDTSSIPPSPAATRRGAEGGKSKKEEATEKKRFQQAEKKRLEKKKSSIKQFKTLGVKITDPAIKEARAIKPNPKGKEMLPILVNEVVTVLLKEHAKMTDDNWLVEKQDGSVGYADKSIFSDETQGEIYEIF